MPVPDALEIAMPLLEAAAVEILMETQILSRDPADPVDVTLY